MEASKPTQKAYVESLNAKFRDECLNEHCFRTLAEARDVVAARRANYNQQCPHSALQYQTPAEFAAAWRFRHAEDARHIEQVELFSGKSDFTNLAVALKLGAGHLTPPTFT